MRKPLAVLLVWLVLVPGSGALPPATKELIGALFQPFLAEQMTLSPDGRHVAYTEHFRQELRVVIMKLEEPYSKVTLSVDDDEGLAFSKEKERATLRFLRWATPNRLVFSPVERTVRLSQGVRFSAPVMAVDADGENPRKLIDSSDYGFEGVPPPLPGGPMAPMPPPSPTIWRPSDVLGFPTGDRDHVLVRARGFYRPGNPPSVVPTTAFKVNVHTGAKTELGSEYILGAVGYDRQGAARIAYERPLYSLDRSFSMREPHALKFDEPWLGPFAGRFIVSPANYFGERAFPLGFDADPNVLYIAANVGRDTFGVYAFNLKTKQRLDPALEHPHFDLTSLEPSYPAPQLVFDEASGRLAGVRRPEPPRISVWQDPELAAAQRTLENKFPRRTVEILEWSDARTAFLLRVTGGTEPGRYFVWQKKENLPLEILRSAPWLETGRLNPTEFFEFDTAAGVHLTGYITLPRASRLNPPPAVICFAKGFPAEAHQEFDREAQVLAAMGLVVVRLNHRGVGGFGLKHREAILAGIDRVPIDDAVATVEWLARRHPVDRRRIATMGAGFGGYLAVRALQLEPDLFRCAVSVNAPLNPAAWFRPPVTASAGVRSNFTQEVNRAFFERGPKDPRLLSVLERPETITQPVFLLLDPALDDSIASANLRLRQQLKGLGGDVDYLEVNEDFAADLPAARIRAYERLEQFFNSALYDYKVKVGETKEVK